MLWFFSSGYKIGIKNLLRPEVRDFWEKLGSYVAPEEEGGHVDLFVPLGASGQLWKLVVIPSLWCYSVNLWIALHSNDSVTFTLYAFLLCTLCTEVFRGDRAPGLVVRVTCPCRNKVTSGKNQQGRLLLFLLENTVKSAFIIEGQAPDQPRNHK